MAIPVEPTLRLPEASSLPPATTPETPRWRSAPERVTRVGLTRLIGLSTIVAGLLLGAVVASRMLRGTGRTTLTPAPSAPSVPSRASPGIVTEKAAPEPESSLASVAAELGYREVHGIDLTTLQHWVEAGARDGFFPDYLGVHAGEGEARFHAVAILPRTPRTSRLRVGVSPDPNQASGEAEKGSDYHRRLFVPYADAGHVRLAIVETGDREAHSTFGGPIQAIESIIVDRKNARQGPPINLAHSPTGFGNRFYCQFVPVANPN